MLRGVPRPVADRGPFPGADRPVALRGRLRWAIPRAALFAFSMSAVAGNALAVLKGNLRAAHGEEMAAEVSDFALVDEVAEVYPGMMMAVPPGRWSRAAGERDGGGRAAERVGGRVPVERMLRSRRGPKKPRPRRSSGKRVHHVSNKKLLDQARGKHPPN